MRARMTRYNSIVGFAMTMLEALCTLLLLRFVYRMSVKLFGLVSGRTRRSNNLNMKSVSSEVI